MQLTFAWLYCVTYSFVFLLKWHAFCERAVTGQWTTSSCETKFIEVRWNSDIMWLCWFPSSFPPTLQLTIGVLPPSMNRILPPSMNRILPQWTASSSTNGILPPLMDALFTLFWNGILPPSLTNGVLPPSSTYSFLPCRTVSSLPWQTAPLPQQTTSFLLCWRMVSLAWRTVLSLPHCWTMSSLCRRMTPSVLENDSLLPPPSLKGILCWRTALWFYEWRPPSLVDQWCSNSTNSILPPSINCVLPPLLMNSILVLESPVQSGFLAQKKKTETETGPDIF